MKVRVTACVTVKIAHLETLQNKRPKKSHNLYRNFPESIIPLPSGWKGKSSAFPSGFYPASLVVLVHIVDVKF